MKGTKTHAEHPSLHATGTLLALSSSCEAVVEVAMAKGVVIDERAFARGSDGSPGANSHGHVHQG